MLPGPVHTAGAGTVKLYEAYDVQGFGLAMSTGADWKNRLFRR